MVFVGLLVFYSSLTQSGFILVKQPSETSIINSQVFQSHTSSLFSSLSRPTLTSEEHKSRERICGGGARQGELSLSLVSCLLSFSAAFLLSASFFRLSFASAKSVFSCPPCCLALPFPPASFRGFPETERVSLSLLLVLLRSLFLSDGFPVPQKEVRQTPQSGLRQNHSPVRRGSSGVQREEALPSPPHYKMDGEEGKV